MRTPEELERSMHEKYEHNMDRTAGGPKIISIVCPHYYDLPCPVCDVTRAYYQAKLGKEHFLRQKARDLNRKLRYYSNVIFPSDPSTVVLFEYGDMIHKMLFGFFNDPKSEYRGFTDKDVGRNCVVKKTVPQGNKRLTDYFIEMKVQQTPLPDMSVLQRMYALDKVTEGIKNGSIKPFFQSQLVEGRTEVRVLPSWLGPRFTIFYHEVPYHYMTQEEFDAIVSGKVSPFKDAGIVLQPNTPQEITLGTTQSPVLTNAWEDITFNVEEKNTALEQSKQSSPKPPCYGGYDAQSPLCTVRCPSLGNELVESCKADTHVIEGDGPIDQKAIRETASRLYSK